MAVMQTGFDCDVLIVGGGINGAGIARDAAGRGLSVLLCEQGDLAASTSSASTKLIHGGLRYLEYYEFNLVRKALIEREVLLRSAPHIMWPLRFVMPHVPGQRPAWLIRAGLFLYDMLARRELLPASRGIDLASHPAGKPLKGDYARGFVYSDGWVDDARLVVLNAMAAREHGATILTHTACTGVRRDGAQWHATLRSLDGAERSVRAAALVNAAGPWTAAFLQVAAPQAQGRTLRLIKGSHIVVRRLFQHEFAYIFQHPDGRIVFAIPYERDFTLIGTTDLDYAGDPGQVVIDRAEIDYLCDLSSYYFRQPVVPGDVVWSYSGVRPLVEDAAADAKAVTRDYRFELDRGVDRRGAPLLSIFGGKITTFRKLAEEAVNLLQPLLAPGQGNHRGAWTANACLPGGDLFGAAPTNRAVTGFDAYVMDLQRQYGWLPARLVHRYARAYGTRIHALLAGTTALAQMGEEIADGLFAVEVNYLRAQEWATRAHDILWRRSKLGLHLPGDTETRLDAWLAAHPLPS
jgi:glycerol-3-phosphate dehydrogenase